MLEMLETRRELFKTSVVSALSLSAGVVAGYAIAELSVSTKAAVPPNAGSVVVMYGSADGGNTHQWYFFNFEQNSSNCRLYSLAATPTLSNINAVDTATWFAVSSPTMVTTDTQITYTKNDGSTDTLQVNLDTSNYLKPGSLSDLLKLVTNENYGQIAGSWNEIGKQKS